MSLIKFEDYPSTNTPISAENLNNNFDEVVLKTQILNEKITSDKDTYSCDYINGTTLYEDSTGTTGDITLNDSAVNYTYLEVFYVSNGTSGSTKVLNPNGTNFRLNNFNNENETTLRFFHTQYTINEKNINVTEKNFNYLINGGTLGSSTDTNYFRIHKIIGYK